MAFPSTPLAAASTWFSGFIGAPLIQQYLVDPLNALAAIVITPTYGSVNAQGSTFSSANNNPSQVFNQFATGSLFSSAGIVATASGIQVPVAGIYRASAVLSFASNNTGRRGGWYSINGSEAPVPNSSGVAGPNTYARVLVPALGFTSTPLETRLLQVPASGVIGVMPYQDSGAAVTVSGVELNVERVA